MPILFLAHVYIKNIQILESIKISDDESNLRHIFGTHFEDLQQIYSGRVFINGSLIFVNLDIDADKIFIKNSQQTIDTDFYKDFWLRNIDQVRYLLYII